MLADIPQLKTILTYHVLPGKTDAAAVSKLTNAKTVEGRDVKIHVNGGVKINDANVVTADVKADNGIIHVLDAVMLPAAKA